LPAATTGASLSDRDDAYPDGEDERHQSRLREMASPENRIHRLLASERAGWLMMTAVRKHRIAPSAKWKIASAAHASHSVL
jgi:hypothetical protein